VHEHERVDNSALDGVEAEAEWVDFDESDDNFVQYGLAVENLDSLAVIGRVTLELVFCHPIQTLVLAGTEKKQYKE
jgi:hypothetical protein